jgi:serine/threonine protein kinase
MASVMTIDRYTIIKQLGKGAFGGVFIAEDKHSGSPVVIKRLDAPIACRGNIKLQLIREVRRACKLAHPNIATVLDVGEYDGVPYVVCEYVDGNPLDTLLRKESPFSIPRAVKLMTGILEGIGHAHRNGLLHLDLKPSRIIVDTEDMPRIMNFGISVMIRAQKDVAGMHGYLSPEHVTNVPFSHRSDIFSIGLILYEMLTGKPAFIAPKFISEFDLSDIPPPSYLNTEVTDPLDRIVMKAIAGKPDQRYADAGGMKKDLNAFFLMEGDSAKFSSQQQVQTTLEKLLEIMERSQDFPAFSQHILEINQKASLSKANPTSPAQLAGIILKDYSLTNKLLRLVNSAFYGNFSGKITTITRAVMVLGFEQVSLAASSLMLFDHLQNKIQSEELKDAAISSFMSGLVARDLAEKMGTQSLEESFICAMLHNIGRHLVVYYLPDQANEIKAMIAQKGENERNAAWAVLRISYENIGMAILKNWNFPVKIIGSLTRLPDGKVEKPSSDEEMLRSLAGYSNELCDIIRKHQGNDRNIALKTLANRFHQVVPVSGVQLLKMLNTAKTQMEKYSDVLGIDIRQSEFMQQLSMGTEPVDENAVVVRPVVGLDKTDAVAAEKQIRDAAIREDRSDILMNGIQEITNALLSDYTLNDMMFMILETIYRGFDFHHVIFCMMEMSRTKMRARYAFGTDIKTVTEKFVFNITNRPTDLFNMAISQQKDIIVEDCQDPSIANLIPDWYQKAFLSPAFTIYPIIVKETPFGLIYADKETKGTILSPIQLNYMKTLRNQSILAIRQKI